MPQFTVAISSPDGGLEIALADTDDAQAAGDLAYSLCVAAKGHSFTVEIQIHADSPAPPPPPVESHPTTPTTPTTPTVQPHGRVARPPR